MYCQSEKPDFNVLHLPRNKMLYVTFYNSDSTRYNATSYRFMLYDDKTYKIFNHMEFSSHPQQYFQTRIEQKPLHEFLKIHKQYIICIANYNECPDYPLALVKKRARRMIHVKTKQTKLQKKIPFAHKKLYFYSIPVKNMFLEETDDGNNTDLDKMLQFYNYSPKK